MTLQQIHYVISIAEYGSINRAAEALFVSQPSLTSSLQSFEKEVGFAIFNRNGKGVTLTDAGAQLMPYLLKDRHLAASVVGLACDKGVRVCISFYNAVSQDDQVWVSLTYVSHPAGEFFCRRRCHLERYRGVLNVVVVDARKFFRVSKLRRSYCDPVSCHIR